jgi:hypothetical protein
VLNRRAAASGCALLVLACGCSSSHKFVQPEASTTTAGAPSTTRRPAATTTSTTTDRATSTTVPRVTVPPVTVPTTVPSSSLAALILDTAPQGFVRQADSVADTGPTDFNKAVQDDVSAEARRSLLVAGFVRGYERQWTGIDSSGDAVNQDFVFLYEFKTPEGAAGYAQHWRLTLLDTNQGVQLLPFTPGFLPGGIGLRVQDQKLGSTGIVIFSKGNYAVKVIVNGGPSVDQSGSADLMAVEQYQRLP